MKKNHDEELEESESEDSDSDSEDSDSDFSEYSDLDSSEEADDAEIKLQVLSWNINGGGQKGKSERRNLYVPEVVRIVDPDVLLLQEVPSEKIMKMLMPTYGIIPRCKKKNNRKYRSV